MFRVDNLTQILPIVVVDATVVGVVVSQLGPKVGLGQRQMYPGSGLFEIHVAPFWHGFGTQGS